MKKIFIYLILIFLLGAFWRFANFNARWTLNQDQSRDALIAIYSTQNHSLPLIGPPSSAGPFSFGPIYYWIIIFFTLIFPTIYGPWLGFALISAFSVLSLAYLGYLIGQKPFAIILAIFGASASAQVFSAPDMLNPNLVYPATILSFIFLTKFIQTKKPIYSWAFGASIGLAISFHFQALGLLIIIPICLISLSTPLKQKLLFLFWTTLGLIFSFLPFIYFNFLTQNTWFNNLFTFLTTGQTRFDSNNSLLMDLSEFWPHLWGNILINIPLSGYLFILLAIYTICWVKLAKTYPLTKTVYILGASLLIQIIALRYYQGPRLPLYLVVFQPFIILLSAFSFWAIYIQNKYVGITLVAIFLIASSYSNLKIINTSSQAPSIMAMKKSIDTKSKGQIALFDQPESATLSLSLYYLLLKENRINSQGYKIGACVSKKLKDEYGQDLKNICDSPFQPFTNQNPNLLYDLNGPPEDQLASSGFQPITLKRISDSLYQNYPK